MAKHRTLAEILQMRGSFVANPQRRPLGESVVPQPSGPVERPSWLAEPAAQVWDEYAPDLIAQRILTRWDTEMFAAWCYLAAKYRENPGGFNASLLVQFRALSSNFYLTPASRVR